MLSLFLTGMVLATEPPPKSIYTDTADRIDDFLRSVTQFVFNTQLTRTWDWPARSDKKASSGKTVYTATTTMGIGSLKSVIRDSSRVVGVVATSTKAGEPLIERMDKGVDGCLIGLLTVSWFDDPPLFANRIRSESEHKGTTTIDGKECHIFVRKYQEQDPYYLRVDTYYIPVNGNPLPVKWVYEEYYVKEKEGQQQPQPWTVVENEYIITDVTWKPKPDVTLTDAQGPGS